MRIEARGVDLLSFLRSADIGARSGISELVDYARRANAGGIEQGLV